MIRTHVLTLSATEARIKIPILSRIELPPTNVFFTSIIFSTEVGSAQCRTVDCCTKIATARDKVLIVARISPRGIARQANRS